MELIELAVSIFLFSITGVLLFGVLIYFYERSKAKIEKPKRNVMTRLMNGDPTVRIADLGEIMGEKPNFAIEYVRNAKEVDSIIKELDRIEFFFERALANHITYQEVYVKFGTYLDSLKNKRKVDPYHIETGIKQFKKKDRIR